MIEFPFDTIGFDLDGTLLDTSPDLSAAVNYALELGGLAPVTENASKDLIGGGAKMMLARAVDQQGGMDPDAFHALYKEMLKYYGAHCAVHTRPYPGALETLDALAAMGVKMAVITNKFESFARTILDQLDLSDRFITIIGGDTMGKGRAKPAPDPLFEAMRLCESTHFAFVGDSSFDVGAARAANVPVVVAAYGYIDKPASELGGDAIIESFGQLIPALQKIAQNGR